MILEPLNRHHILNFDAMNETTLSYIVTAAMLCSGVLAIFVIVGSV